MSRKGSFVMERMIVQMEKMRHIVPANVLPACINARAFNDASDTPLELVCLKKPSATGLLTVFVEMMSSSVLRYIAGLISIIASGILLA